MQKIKHGFVAIGLLWAVTSGTLAKAATFEPLSEQTPSATSDLQIAQAVSSEILSTLGNYIQTNQSNFDDYALRQANAIGESAQWENAKLHYLSDSGIIILDLNGYAILPPGAAVLFGSPPIRLLLQFTPDSCLQYSYTTYQINGGGLIRGEISAEVAEALNDVRTDMDASINREVTQSLSNLGLSSRLSCR